MTNTPRDTPQAAQPSPPPPTATAGTHLIRALHETALYPPHAPRTPSALYLANHHRMVVVEDRPCIACGVRNSDLRDPHRRADPTINRFGASAIETHHHTIEWALANAVDLAKFNRRVRPTLLTRTGNDAKYGHDLTQDEMLAWIAGDEDNLYPICDVQHRHPLVGVHCITYPIWSVQDLLIDNYNLTGFVAPTPAEAAALTALPLTTGEATAP